MNEEIRETVRRVLRGKYPLTSEALIDSAMHLRELDFRSASNGLNSPIPSVRRYAENEYLKELLEEKHESSFGKTWEINQEAIDNLMERTIRKLEEELITTRDPVKYQKICEKLENVKEVEKKRTRGY